MLHVTGSRVAACGNAVARSGLIANADDRQGSPLNAGLPVTAT
jgi:hypothetical protein